MTDDVDVVVTDGFTGNVALKTLEGGMQDPGQGASSRPSAPTRETQAASEVLLPGARCRSTAPLDPDTTGGAMLLGVDGVCIISHGSSSATAIVNAVRVAKEMRRRTTSSSPPARRRLAARDVRTWTVHKRTKSRGRLESPAPHPPTRRSHPCPPRPTSSKDRPWTAKQVFELIRDRLADILEIEPVRRSTRATRFADDLEADSLALIELVEALEEELGERTRRASASTTRTSRT